MSWNALDAIGKTPVVRLRRMVTSEMAEVYVKLEYFNPTASYKDRMALAMIAAAEQRGDLLAGMSVLEWSVREAARAHPWPLSARSRVIRSR